MSKCPPPHLTALERETLESWSHTPRTPQALALRARLVLACAEGQTNAAVGRAIGVSCQTAGKWRARFLAEGTLGLRDAARSGAPRHLKVEDLEWVLTLTLLATPAGAARWTTRSMAEACAMSQSAISRAWRGFGLRPSSPQKAHRRADALILAKFENLLRLYLDPQPRAQLRVHRVETRAALRDWLAATDAAVPLEERAELILTECGADAEVEARAWLVGRPRFALHVAPRGKRWLELIGVWFPAGNASRARRGLRALASERRSAPYTVTPLGRETIELATRASIR